MLGGKDNFAVDRAASEAALRITPDGPQAGQAARAFLRRAVRYLAGEAGIRQFLDIGSGLPTQGNVHEIAHEVDPGIRVVYVDNDPMVLAHSRALLDDAHTTTVVRADLRQPQEILKHPDVLKALDFDEPIGLLLLNILHHINDDEDPAGLAAQMIAPLAPGSYVAISHFHDPGDEHPEVSVKLRGVQKVFNETLGTGRWRYHAEIMSYLDGLELVEPGLVPLSEWHPDGQVPPLQTDTYYGCVGGVARKN